MEKSYPNNWQKYGAITSIIWMLFAGIFQYRANTKFMGEASLSVYETCIAKINKESVFESINCDNEDLENQG